MSDKLSQFSPPPSPSPTNSLFEKLEGEGNANDSDIENTDDELWLDALTFRKHGRHCNRFGKVVEIKDVAHVT
jgi:hypothetical protein